MTITLATFNLLDWFDLDAAAIARRVAAVAPQVRALAADVIGFQEVASDAAFQRLADASGFAGATIVHGTRDARGIGCSLASRLPVLRREILTCEALQFPAFSQGDPEPFGARIPLRRGVVSVLVDGGPIGKVQLFVAHLKSMRALPMKDARGAIVEPASQGDWADAEVRTLVWRAAEALFVRRAVDVAIARAEADHVVVMGDLNDVAGSLPLRALTGKGEGALASVGETVPLARRTSIFHHGKPSAIDHILVSSALMSRLLEARFVCEDLVDMSELPRDAPMPAGSDHAPLFARFGGAVLV